LRRIIAGVDSGNTKTAFVSVTVDGDLVARSLSGPSNYQTLGPDGCQKRLVAAVAPLAAELAGQQFSIEGWGFGLAGLDRDRDLQILDNITFSVVNGVCGAGGDGSAGPEICKVPRILVNDAFLSLRAGTCDGVGVAVSAGTSGNCVGMNRAGTRLQIGGIASELGDGGGGFDIAIAGLKAAGRARDGRAPATRISDLYLAVLGLTDIADVVDFMIPGNKAPVLPEGMAMPPTDIEQPIPPMIGLLAPLVFQAASEGDIVARNILEHFGRDLGISARVAALRLGFAWNEYFPLVLGGSVLQHATDPTFSRALVGEVASAFPNVVASTLDEPPVLGAVLYGFDAAGISVSSDVRSRITTAVAGLFQ
jgi:N-acetylglucosamine kinase